MEEKELIKLEQLPIIKEKLDMVSQTIKERLDKALALECTEETVKSIKKTRADFNNEFKSLEEQRKNVKNAINAKYKEFEDIYNEKIANIYRDADTQFKEKIDNIENDLKSEKENELREFANQHFESSKIIGFARFEDIGLNITLSASMKSLKEQIVEFCDKVRKDLDLIALEEYKDEILLEYRKCFDFSKAKLEVIERHKELNELKGEQNQIKEIEEKENQIEKEVDKIIETPEEIIEVAFKIKTTISKVKKLKEFLKNEEIEYE